MKILLPEEKGYKANLHCHTTGSDGALTPERMKELYKAHGYSILAFTDHAYMEDRSSLTDENFVAISGYENHVEPTWVKGKPRSRECYHLNFYSPKPDKVGMIGITDYYFNFTTRYYRGLSEMPVNELIGGFFKHTDGGFGVENLNRLLKQAKEVGYLVVLNHPDWSGLTPQNFLGIDEYLLGVEIVNYGSAVGGYTPEEEIYYDLMLRSGQRVFCFANDDNHMEQEKKGWKNINNIPDMSFGAYNIMYPDKLTYDGVFACMKEGRSYASTGAEIRGIAVDGEKVYVGAENAKYIRFVSDRGSQIRYRNDENTFSATFDLYRNDEYNERTGYFRIVVEDENGKKAFSRAYFLNEFAIFH